MPNLFEKFVSSVVEISPEDYKVFKNAAFRREKSIKKLISEQLHFSAARLKQTERREIMKTLYSDMLKEDVTTLKKKPQTVQHA